MVCGRASRCRDGGIHQEGENRHGEGLVGDRLLTKEKGSIRLCFQNINGLGFDDEQLKLQRLHHLMAENEVDALGIAEVNTCWSKMGAKENHHRTL